MMTIKFIKLNELARVPQYMTNQASGCDAYSVDSVFIQPGQTVVVRTGLAIEIPIGYECQVRTRSGMAVKNQVVVLNSPGTIDADYRGEVMVILHNHGVNTFEVNVGDRIAQLVFAPVTEVRFEQVDKLSYSTRGEGKFGSTG